MFIYKKTFNFENFYNKKKMKKLLIKLITKIIFYSGVWIIILKIFKPKGLLVFNYHNFSTFSNDRDNIGSVYKSNYSENFEKQIVFLKKYFNPKNSLKIEKKDFNILTTFLTFDDGYKDNYDIAYPILKKYNIATAFFIVTDFTDTKELAWYDKLRYLIEKNPERENEIKKIMFDINHNNQNFSVVKTVTKNLDFQSQKRLVMNSKELKEIGSNKLFAICPHTANHIPLNSQEKETQKFQIVNSLEKIKKINNYSNYFFSYPNGLYNKDTLKILKENNFKFAFTTKNGINRNINRNLELKRIGFNASDSIPILTLKILLNIFK